jgi:hypothetical protein
VKEKGSDETKENHEILLSRLRLESEIFRILSLDYLVQICSYSSLYSVSTRHLRCTIYTYERPVRTEV